jgi:two-component sensor histidine kinase
MNITQKIEAAKIIQASLTEKETLLREIHHRVKNNLQSLLALLQMEGRQVQDRALVSRFDNMRSRIQVMAGIHENLYKSESLSAVNMGRQISSLCENLGQLDPQPHHIEIVADTEYLCCSIDVAVPLGVLANEIIINAVKHAFPDDRPGRIEVSFRQGWNGVALTVRDNGIGDTGHRGNGIGKELIAALADQLKAEVSVDAASGTTVHIVLPADDFKPCPAEAIKLPTSSMAVSQAFASGIGQPGVAS